MIQEFVISFNVPVGLVWFDVSNHLSVHWIAFTEIGQPLITIRTQFDTFYFANLTLATSIWVCKTNWHIHFFFICFNRRYRNHWPNVYGKTYCILILKKIPLSTVHSAQTTEKVTVTNSNEKEPQTKTKQNERINALSISLKWISNHIFRSAA